MVDDYTSITNVCQPLFCLYRPLASELAAEGEVEDGGHQGIESGGRLGLEPPESGYRYLQIGLR